MNKESIPDFSEADALFLDRFYKGYRSRMKWKYFPWYIKLLTIIIAPWFLIPAILFQFIVMGINSYYKKSKSHNG